MHAVARTPSSSAAQTAPRPERWRLDAGEQPDALLTIPADARRERRFEISVTMSVRARPGARAPWHELRVLADGELQWSRRIGTDADSGYDGLDYRFRHSVPVARELRVQALVECEGAERLRLVIEAEEDA